MAKHFDSNRAVTTIERQAQRRSSRRTKNLEHFLAERSFQKLCAEHKAGE